MDHEDPLQVRRVKIKIGDSTKDRDIRALAPIFPQEEQEGVLEDIALLQAHPELNGSQARVLVWAQLRVLDSQDGGDALLQFVSSVPPGGENAPLDHELFAFLRELQLEGRYTQLAALSERWLPKLATQPQLQRQVWLLQIDAFREQGRKDEALVASRDLLAAHPDSGNAWRVLAEQSEATGDLFGAERAGLFRAVAPSLPTSRAARDLSQAGRGGQGGDGRGEAPGAQQPKWRQ